MPTADTLKPTVTLIQKPIGQSALFLVGILDLVCEGFVTKFRADVSALGKRLAAPRGRVSELWPDRI